MNHELIKLGEKTYVLLNPVNVGIYVLDGNNVCLIDSGSSKDYAKVISQILDEHNWNLKYIINTHSHADHIGGNSYLQNKYSCKIYSSKIEAYFINSTFLEPALMYGASPLKGLYNHTLVAKESQCCDVNLFNCVGIKIIELNGHSPNLIGVLTSDNVFFVGDAYTSTEIIQKYSIQYTYDVAAYLKTIDSILKTNYDYYVPSHGKIEKQEDAFKTINTNKEVCLKIKDEIFKMIGYKISFSELVEKIVNRFNISLNIVQYYVIKATIKAYITSLELEEKIELLFENGNMFIKII